MLLKDLVVLNYYEITGKKETYTMIEPNKDISLSFKKWAFKAWIGIIKIFGKVVLFVGERIKMLIMISEVFAEI